MSVYQGSTVVRRRPKDGKGVLSVTEYYLATNLSEGVTQGTLGWTANPSEAVLTTTNKYLWRYEITTYTDGTSSTTNPVIIGTYGEKGDNGLPGALLVQKEWVQGDTHRYTDEIKDYIYVRGASAAESYWYTLASKGTVTADVAPTGGKTPNGYVEVNWMKELAVKFLIAEEANLANFVFQNGRLSSEDGLSGLNGVAGSTNNNPVLWAGGTYNDALAGTANAIIRHDGTVKFTDGEFIGVVHAIDGDFTGTVNSTSGNIGGFSIGVGSLQAISGSNSMLLSSNIVRFLGQYSSVYIGADTFPASGGGAILGTQRIEINRTVSGTVYGNVGMYIDVKGSTAYDDAGYQYTGNHAIYAVGGDYAGFRLRTRRISTSQTLSNMDNVIICVNTSSITITLPSSPIDGQIYFITSISSSAFTIQVGNTSHRLFKTINNIGTSYEWNDTRDRIVMLIWDKVNLYWRMGQTGAW